MNNDAKEEAVKRSIPVSAQTGLSDDATAQLVDRVKQTPASQLDSALPKMPFEQWLQHEAGDDATLAWAVRMSDDSGKSTPWVEPMFAALVVLAS